MIFVKEFSSCFPVNFSTESFLQGVEFLVKCRAKVSDKKYLELKTLLLELKIISYCTLNIK